MLTRCKNYVLLHRNLPLWKCGNFAVAYFNLAFHDVAIVRFWHVGDGQTEFSLVFYYLRFYPTCYILSVVLLCYRFMVNTVLFCVVRCIMQPKESRSLKSISPTRSAPSPMEQTGKKCCRLSDYRTKKPFILSLLTWSLSEISSAQLSVVRRRICFCCRCS